MVCLMPDSRGAMPVKRRGHSVWKQTERERGLCDIRDLAAYRGANGRTTTNVMGLIGDCVGWERGGGGACACGHAQSTC